MRISFLTLLLCVFAIPTASAEKGSPLWAALGDETPSAELCSAGKDAPRRLCVGGRFTSIAHMRNDSDFDPTPRFFDPNGQTDGQAATFLRTHVRYETGSALHVSYEMEVGWNAWSRHDPGLPDAFLPGDEGGLAYRHRQLFADARVTKGVRARVGFQEIKDPSGLFLDHLGGALAIEVKRWGATSTFWLGQLPDSTYEGVAISDDNFIHDNFFGGISYTRHMTGIELDFALIGLRDHRAVDRPLTLGSFVLGARHETARYQAWAHAVVQMGTWEGSGVAGVDQDIMAWAGQAGVQSRHGKFLWGMNAFALSPDDAHDGNGTIGTFFGAGKNRSATTLLTEDEYRDRYDNFDERMGTPWGPFLNHGAGLAVIDATLGYRATDCWMTRLVIGDALNIEPGNALDKGHAGLELSWLNDVAISEDVVVFAHAQLLMPDEGLAVFANDVDRSATELLYGGEVGITARF